MDRPADCDTLVIPLSDIKENGSERRKSTVSFCPDLEYNESRDTSLNDYEKEIYEEKPFESEYYFPSEARASIFSRISDMPFPILSSNFKCFFLIFSTLVIFFMGIIVGTLTTKYLFSNGLKQDKVNNFI